MKDPDLIRNDPWLEPYRSVIKTRMEKCERREHELCRGESLQSFASGHLWFGIHREKEGLVIREWAPSAREIFLLGDFNEWKIREDFRFKSLEYGNWEIFLKEGTLKHGDRYKLLVRWDGGEGERIPAWCTRVIQDPDTKVFDAQYWMPEDRYSWKNAAPSLEHFQPLIYEAHIGMATEEHKVGSFREFREKVLPHVIDSGYNTLQLMAIQEHPYYGSFGYHVSNFFAVSSRFGTPEELKELIDEAHGHGLAVIMDIVHSHAVKNENEGLGRFDGNPAQFFHGDHRREHVAWDSLCFDYGKNEVTHYLLSNVNFWLTEYHFDGFRFDGVTSMLYYDHGLEKDFTSYDQYFDGGQDEDAIIYLSLANKMTQEIRSGAISIAEDMSGYPGLAVAVNEGGIGFSYRLAMGTPDYWIKTIKERPDEQWNMEDIFRELTSKRADEKTIAYAESHDQALVGDKTIIFRLIDQEMYWHMDKASESVVVDRGLALHKMIRLITAACAGDGYLTFMGNEFGHPEWIDFPREGNNWSYQYARRQWSLIENPDLRYRDLFVFEKDMLKILADYRLYSTMPNHVKSDQGDLVVAFERAGLLFVFNFHPSSSYMDYGLAVDAGKYSTLLCTDQPEYGGFQRFDTAMIHRTQREASFGLKQNLKLYLPARTGIVLKRQEIPRVR